MSEYEPGFLSSKTKRYIVYPEDGFDPFETDSHSDAMTYAKRFRPFARVVDRHPQLDKEQLVAERAVKAPKTPDEIIAERQKTHGEFKDNARVAQTIRYVCRQAPGWEDLSFVQREALDHIAGKIGRIVASSKSYPDHFRDIGGYARLGELDAITQWGCEE